VQSHPISGGTSMTEYIYDAEGHRVAKGSITSFNCNTGANGFVAEVQEVIGPGGQAVTETDGSGNWQHTNVYAGSLLLATYDAQGLHFYLADPLGTRRVQTDPTGTEEGQDTSLPYGDGVTQTASDDPSTQHYAQLTFDPETGLDHAEARQYTPWMGRWTAPDPYNGSYDLSNPQSMNRYSYVNNNPLGFVDPSGLATECTSSKIVDPSTGKALGPSTGSCKDNGEWYDPFDWPKEIGSLFSGLFDFGGGPKFKGSFQPRPSVGGAPNKTAPPKQPPKKPCPPGTRAAGVVQAASGAGDAAGAFTLAGVHLGTAGALLGAGCFDPTPAEPVTCLAAGAGAGSLLAGAGALGYLGYQDVKEEVIPGIEQAVTCVPE
jgi:RHS repeat-associated protein